MDKELCTEHLFLDSVFVASLSCTSGNSFQLFIPRSCTILTFHNIYLTEVEFNIISYSLNLCLRIGLIYGSVSK